MARILAAMSGGVDSAVAAALLARDGHDVTGVHLKLADLPLHQQVPGQGCCTLEDAQDARRVAQVLDIPFYVWDLSEVFEAEVRGPFADTYAAGATPNPCITCNERVKYRALLDRARRLGFDALATGHHARIVDGTPPQLRRATDRAKDQSYVLYMATPDELGHTRLPVGELTKDEVRATAEDLGLRVTDKPDSHDVCFIPDGDTAGWLDARLPSTTGEIVDLDGTVLGRHEGVWGFTIGQRRGLGLDHHERRYVVALDAARNRVLVGPREALECRWLEIGEASWTTGAPPGEQVTVQIRAHAPAVPAAMSRHDGRWRITPREPLEGVARGQAAVVYDADGEVCLGGGTIESADRPALPVAAGR